MQSADEGGQVDEATGVASDEAAGGHVDEAAGGPRELRGRLAEEEDYAQLGLPECTGSSRLLRSESYTVETHTVLLRGCLTAHEICLNVRASAAWYATSPDAALKKRCPSCSTSPRAHLSGQQMHHRSTKFSSTFPLI